MNIFFSGIGGSGVSAIACFMAAHGHSVSGSDRLFDNGTNKKLCRMFQNQNIRIFKQDGSGISHNLDLLVFSTAVEKDSPEIKKAREIGIKMMSRPEMLASIVSQYSTIAIAGTSGKSTTSGMLAFLMKMLGIGINFIGGGRVKQFSKQNNPGNYLAGSSNLLVIEACESDGTIVNYMPEHTIILNLDLDHHRIEETASMFETLSLHTSGKILINADDENLRRCRITRKICFSIKSESKYRAEDIKYMPFETFFKIKGQHFRLSLPGSYNLYNALACIAFLSEYGASIKDISDVLPDFKGIERRFDVHLNNERHIVIDDYAHNPHKIKGMMETVGKIKNNVCYIFQPHGYGPTRLLRDGYINTFASNLRHNDHLIVLPVFYAGGTVQKDISGNDIVVGVQALGKSAEYVEDRAIAATKAVQYDACVVFGARDESLSDFAEDIALQLRQI